MTKRNAGLDLVNSEHIRGPDQVDDELDNPLWVERFLRRWSLPNPLGSREMMKLRELRDVLRDVVDELGRSNSISDECLQKLQGFMPASVTRTQLERDGLGGYRVVHVADDDRCVSAEIAQEFAKLVAEDGWRRVKACNNEHCRWAFYDESRNRSRRWCDSSACGNVMKVRAFRKRQGQGGEEEN